MMQLQHAIAWRREPTIWILSLVIVLVMGIPLVFWSAAQARSQSTSLEIRAQALPAEAKGSALLGDVIALADAILSHEAFGRAELDLNALAQAHSTDESDNVRWSLVRRTPEAAQVYQRETGVDWTALRRVSATGTILIPAGFPWSFNETFKLGPGYKDASGILAGGHCALASVFRGAAVQAGLATTSRQHASPIPGFAQEDSVNILWGRDDLVVHNTNDRDLYFVWEVGPERVRITVMPVTDALPLPPLPDWEAGTIAMVYGRPGPGGWGSLGETAIVDHALYLARTFAGRVDEWNGVKPVAAAVNPNVVMSGKATERELYLHHLIAEARRQGYYVMLDVKTGDQDPLTVLEQLLDKYLQENVWLDWDIEGTVGGTVSAQQINQVAETYFARRRAQGFQAPGIFAFYVFKDGQVTDPAQVVRRYDGGVVVPIFDGFGSPDTKIAKTQRIVSSFGEGPYGIMEFETRWGNRYDSISARAYFEAYPDALVFASQ